MDFNGDLYGQKVTVKLLEYMREEKQFDTVEQLKAAIENDSQAAVKAFSYNNAF